MQFLLSVSERFGDSYTTCIMLPVFLIAVGDEADLTYFASAIHSRIKGNGSSNFSEKCAHNCFIFDCSLVGLRPRSAVADRLSTMCVLPLLLAGVLGAPGKHEQLAEYLRKLLLEENSLENPPTKHTPEIINAIRFIWFVYHHKHS